MNTIHPLLKSYIETEILPRYNKFDPAHRIGHVQEVITQSLQLAAHYEVDRNMVYTIAAYHDTGLCEGREMHHKSSGRILREDKILREFLLPDSIPGSACSGKPLFTPQQIEIMAQAVEDHRASSSNEPRSIYGKIVAEADRIIDGPTIVQRTIQYGFSNYPQLNKEGHYQRFLEHMEEKYASGGYLKLWIPESANATRLAEFQKTLEDPAATRKIFEEEWEKLIQH